LKSVVTDFFWHKSTNALGGRSDRGFRHFEVELPVPTVFVRSLPVTLHPPVIRTAAASVSIVLFPSSAQFAPTLQHRHTINLPRLLFSHLVTALFDVRKAHFTSNQSRLFAVPIVHAFYRRVSAASLSLRLSIRLYPSVYPSLVHLLTHTTHLGSPVPFLIPISNRPPPHSHTVKYVRKDSGHTQTSLPPFNHTASLSLSLSLSLYLAANHCNSINLNRPNSGETFLAAQSPSRFTNLDSSIERSNTCNPPLPVEPQGLPVTHSFTSGFELPMQTHNSLSLSLSLFLPISSHTLPFSVSGQLIHSTSLSFAQFVFHTRPTSSNKHDLSALIR
jgi:hypothetical protein